VPLRAKIETEIEIHDGNVPDVTATEVREAQTEIEIRSAVSLRMSVLQEVSTVIAEEVSEESLKEIGIRADHHQLAEISWLEETVVSVAEMGIGIVSVRRREIEILRDVMAESEMAVGIRMMLDGEAVLIGEENEVENEVESEEAAEERTGAMKRIDGIVVICADQEKMEEEGRDAVMKGAWI